MTRLIVCICIGFLSAQGVIAQHAHSHKHEHEHGPSKAGIMGGHRDILVEDIPQGELRSQLEALPVAAQQAALQNLKKLQFHKNEIPSIRTDKDGMIYYVCEKSPDDPAAAAAEESKDPTTVKASVPVSNPPVYNSNPGAPFHIYLDFNGGVITNTSWNSSRNVTRWDARAWSSDGDESTFTDSEQTVIRRVYERMAEDYAPFNVNVTTDPQYDPDVTGGANNIGWCLFTPTVDANGTNCPHNGSGGIAYVGVYGGGTYASAYQPAWTTPASAQNMAEAGSHEMGHNMGLNHDGTSSLEYYGGHVSTANAPSWGPIMGTGYGRDVSQWSLGEYLDSNNAQDDLSIINARIPYRTDDHGDTSGSATVIAPAGDGSFSETGIIETTGETDVFSFSTGAGTVTLNAKPFKADSSTAGGNLDIILELYDTGATLIASNNLANVTTAGVSTVLSAGTYFAHIRPTGTGTPLTDPREGYTVYGSVGQYTLDGNLILPGVSVSESSNTTDVIEGGATDTYTLSLGTAPTSTVTITISSDSQVNVSSNTAIFTPANWNNPQNFTVTAIDDSTEEGNHSGTITHSASSLDPAFNGIGVASIVANITDNDNIMVSAPNGGETWIAGQTNTINWVSLMGGNVKLDLLRNGLFNEEIIASTPNNGSFSWAIPSNQSPATNYSIRITSVETSSVDDDSDADFSILPAPVGFYLANMDSDPGWTLGTGWGYGVPTGAGQDAYGGPDPTSGSSGANVIGYALDGDYEISLTATRWATTPAIDCSNHQNIKLNFMRWLGIEESTYDKVYIQVSTNGSNWSSVWSNPSTSRVDDQAWVNVEYDISSVADGAAAVQIRWGLGTTDGSWNWCGWNLDDVQLIGSPLTAPTGITVTQSGGSTDVTEGSGNDTYTIELESQPSDTVTVSVTPDSQVNATPTNLTFTTNDWNIAQTVTVTAVDDTDHELAHTGGITHTSSSADNDYDNVSIDGVLVNITDNDNNAPTANAGPDQNIVLTGGSWSPANANPGLWLDADDAATITTNGSAISSWQDKSGNNRNGTQVISVYQPTLTSSGLNGKNVVTFDGSSDFLTLDLDFLASQHHSAFIVTKPTIYSDIYGAANGSAGPSSLHVGFSSASAYRMNYWGNDWNGVVSANFRAGNANILNYIWLTGSAKEIYANGSSEGTSSGTAGTIGVMSGGGQIGKVVNHVYYGGDIAEFIIMTGTVSQVTRETMEGYLAHKWGIESYLPGGHPYKSTSPSSAEVTTNLDGTVNDSDGDPVTSSWSVISGPGVVNIADTNAVDTTATFYTEGTYVLRLTATDGIGQTSDDITIIVGSSPVDGDGDGMADTWETTHSLTDPNGDEDGDGATNQEEFMAGTDPNDDTKVLRIISITLNGSGQPIIVWQSEQDGTAPTRQYKVLRNSTLSGGSWSEAANGISAGGATTQHTDSGAPASNSFYVIEPY